MKSSLRVLLGAPFVVLLACSSEPKESAVDDSAATRDTSGTTDSAADSASPTGDDTGNADTGPPPDTGDTGADDTADTSVPPDTSDTGTVDTADTGTPPDTSDTSDTGGTDLCADLPGSRWSSVDELECGRAPGGVALCHWQIQFGADGTFNWRYSDVAEVGEWSCTGGILTASTWSRGAITATLVDATHLTWVDVAYVRD